MMGTEIGLATVHACRITVVYLSVYAAAIIMQVYVQKKLYFRARSVTKQGNSKPKSFDRYESPEMLHADRAVGNMLEWMPCFLGLLWVLVAMDKFQVPGEGGFSLSYHAAWSHVGFRALYVILIHWHGVPLDGWHSSLLVSTYPAYVCLIMLYAEAIMVLW